MMNATREAARIAQTLIEANGPTVRAGVLARHHDVSGISGTGIVAFWVEAETGPVVLWGWRCDGIEWFPSFAAAVECHGHDGATVFEVVL